jgi:hypothetical protein
LVLCQFTNALPSLSNYAQLQLSTLDSIDNTAENLDEQDFIAYGGFSDGKDKQDGVPNDVADTTAFVGKSSHDVISIEDATEVTEHV